MTNEALSTRTMTMLLLSTITMTDEVAMHMKLLSTITIKMTQLSTRPTDNEVDKDKNNDK